MPDVCVCVNHMKNHASSYCDSEVEVERVSSTRTSACYHQVVSSTDTLVRGCNARPFNTDGTYWQHHCVTLSCTSACYQHIVTPTFSSRRLPLPNEDFGRIALRIDKR